MSLWRLQLVWKILECRRRLYEEPSAADAVLCREAIHIGELLLRFGDAGNTEVLRHLGLVYNLAGDHASAVRCLEPVAETLPPAEAWPEIAALADSYVLVGRRADAVDLLQRAARDPELAERAAALLRSLGGP